MSEDPTLAASDVTRAPLPAKMGDLGEIRRGSMFGRYVVLDLLGHGGMGTVYAAYDPQLDRRVAIKLLLSVRAKNEESRLRLRREAQAMARLKHPHTVTVHDVGEHDGQIYLAMEFIEGETLKEWLRAEDRAWNELVDVFRAAGQGLAAAHREGIVHRDFKPDNVMIENGGRVVVMDFGLARRAEEPESRDDEPLSEFGSSASSDLTRTGSLIGTPAYMSPEQLDRHDVGAASDQFSYFVTFYEALYGERPFQAKSFGELAVAIRTNRRQPIPEDRDVPRWLRDVVIQGLSPLPEDRHPSMDVIVASLERDRGRRRRQAWFFGVVGLGLGSLGLGVAMRPDEAERACDRGSQTITETWNAQRRETVGAAFAATQLPLASDAWARTSGAIDDWAESWATAFHDVCAATRIRGEQSDESLDTRMRCLEQRRAGLDAMLNELESVDEGLLQRASSAVSSLASPNGCRDFEDLTGDPVDDSDQELARRLNIEIARLEARRIAGRFDAALEGSQQVLDEVGERPWPELQAKATKLLAIALDKTDHVDEAIAAHRGALHFAARAGNRRLEAAVWLDLVGTIANRSSRPKEAEPLLLPAEIAIEAAGNDPLFRVGLERKRGALAFELGRTEEALAHRRRVLTLVQDAELPPPELEISLDNLGNALYRAGRFEEAEPYQRQALALAQERLGPDHPGNAEILNNLAQTCDNLGRYACARDSYDESLRILENSLGRDHSKYADTLYNVAVFEYYRLDLEVSREHTMTALDIWTRRLGSENRRVAAAHIHLGNIAEQNDEYDAALESFARAEEVLRASVGGDHPDITTVLNNRANALRGLGRTQEALPLYDQALSLAQKRRGPDHPGLAFELCNKADALMELGRAAEAVEPAARAVELRESGHPQPLLLGIAYFTEARARWEANDDRALALERARAALAAYQRAETGDPEAREAKVSAWLRARGA